MIAMLFVAQVAAAAPTGVDSTYSSAALRDLIALAAEANRKVPAQLMGFRSRVQTENSLIRRDTLGGEAIVQAAQFASNGTWTRSTGYELHVIGMRTNGLFLGSSILNIDRGWIQPMFYGQRMPIGYRYRGETTYSHTVHPFSTDRDSFYRFSGGDTVAVIRSGTREIKLARIIVQGRAVTRDSIALFDGELLVDAERAQIVRLRGRFLLRRGPTRGTSPARFLGLSVIPFVAIDNAEIDGRFWLPVSQRIEVQSSNTLLDDHQLILRIVSKIGDYEIDTTGVATPIDSMRLKRLTYATRDSLGQFDDWPAPLGKVTATKNAEDFADVRPAVDRPVGKPVTQMSRGSAARLLHYDYVQGWFTGVDFTTRLRDAAPGVSLRTYAGYAWSEQTVRGGASVSKQWNTLTAGVRAERILASTNDFDPETRSTLFAFPGDYVDRRSAGSFLSKRIAGNSLVLLQLLRARDGSVRFHTGSGDSSFGRVNRGSFDGDYSQTSLDYILHPEAATSVASSTVGVRAHVERAFGDLDWWRTTLRLDARKWIGDVGLSAATFAGAVGGSPVPPQQLFELGGDGSGLTSYGYKTFVGDRAVAANTRVDYVYHYFRRPYRIRRIPIPLPNPGLFASISASTSQISSASIQPSIDALRVSRVLTATPGVRGVVSTGVSIFPFAVAGVQRRVGEPGEWRPFVSVLGIFHWPRATR